MQTCRWAAISGTSEKPGLFWSLASPSPQGHTEIFRWVLCVLPTNKQNKEQKIWWAILGSRLRGSNHLFFTNSIGQKHSRIPVGSQDPTGSWGKIQFSCTPKERKVVE